MRVPLHVLAIFIILSTTAQNAYGHGFGQIRDLPVPPYLYWYGGGAVVVLSFVIISIVVGKTTANPYGTKNLLQYGRFRNLAESRAFLMIVKVPSVFLLFLVIVTGLFGSQVSVWNFAPTFVWIIWWVGFGFVHALGGNIWALINPWKAVYDWVGRLVSLNGKQAPEPKFQYPTKLGVLPALILFFIFVWVELVYPEAATPRDIAILGIAYSAITWLGMFFFGKHVWLRFGEAFSVFFRFLSMLAPTEVRVRDKDVCNRCSSDCLIEDGDCVNCYDCYSKSNNREVNLRPFALGLLHGERVGFDRVAFIVLMLSSVTFDGFSKTYFWFDLIGLGPYGGFRYSLVYMNTLGLAGFFLLLSGIYYAFISLVKLFSRSQLPVKVVAFTFIFSLLPIAMVYQFAHYSTYLVINGQQIIKLISDPFGFEWDLFGTRNLPLNTALDYFSVWHYQVALIVVGHIVAVYIAHLMSLRAFRDHRSASRSQVPMMVLMVMYTIIGLWLLSAPSVG